MKGKLNYPQQLTFNQFFPLITENATSIEKRVVYNKIPASQATFKSGLASRIHRWFRLTPSFGPDLVQEILLTLGCTNRDAILDPFTGVGTTLIECQLQGLTSYGFEINPFLHFVASSSLKWDVCASELKENLVLICNEFQKLDSVVNLRNLADYGLSIPKIHNPTKWWRPDVLKQILVLKNCIDSLVISDSMRNFFDLALSGVLVPDLTNVSLNRLQLHFIDRSSDNIQVIKTFTSHLENMVNDLEYIQEIGFDQKAKVYLVDSTNIDNLNLDMPIRFVITSPPYPNRYSYVWNTRPYLYLFNFFSNAKQASDLDRTTIGGTWGSATSILAKGRIEPEYQIIKEVVNPVAEQIRFHDNLMANYAMKYFNLLAKQIKEMDRLLSRDAGIAYVVGCSWLKGIYIETDVILGKIIEGLELGYKVSDIQRIRQRNSGKKLHESIVYAWKK